MPTMSQRLFSTGLWIEGCFSFAFVKEQHVLTNNVVEGLERFLRGKRLFISILFDTAVFGFLIPALFIFLSRKLDGIFHMPRYDPLFLKVLGFFLVLLGITLIMWAYYLLVRVGKGYTLEFFGKGVLPVTERLVTVGPYSKVRHPMALGHLIMLLGIAFAINSLSGVFVLFPLILFASCLYLKFFEEKALGERFKEEYDEYRENTNFLIPWFKKRKKSRLKR